MSAEFFAGRGSMIKIICFLFFVLNYFTDSKYPLLPGFRTPVLKIRIGVSREIKWEKICILYRAMLNQALSASADNSAAN